MGAMKTVILRLDNLYSYTLTVYTEDYLHPFLCEGFVKSYFGSHKELPSKIKLEVSLRKLKSSKLIQLSNTPGWYMGSLNSYRPMWYAMSRFLNGFFGKKIYVRITPL